METRQLPPIVPENTVFIPSRNKIPRSPLLNYVNIAAMRLHESHILKGEEVIYLSGTGEATSRVVDASELLKRYCPDARVVLVGIRTCKVPTSRNNEPAKEISNLVVGFSKKNYYEPLFGFLPDTYFERSAPSF